MNFGTIELIIIIAVLLLAAQLISQHLQSKHKLASKRLELGQVDVAQPPVLKEDKKFRRDFFWGGTFLVVSFVEGFILCSLAFFLLLSVQVSDTRKTAAHARVQSTPTSSSKIGSSTYPDIISSYEVPRRNAVEPIQQRRNIEDWKKALPFPSESICGCRILRDAVGLRMIHEIIETNEKPDDKNSAVPTKQTLLVNVEKLRAAGHPHFLEKFKAAF